MPPLWQTKGPARKQDGQRVTSDDPYGDGFEGFSTSRGARRGTACEAGSSGGSGSRAAIGTTIQLGLRMKPAGVGPRT
jgi:hypothetical protein